MVTARRLDAGPSLRRQWPGAAAGDWQRIAVQGGRRRGRHPDNDEMCLSHARQISPAGGALRAASNVGLDRCANAKPDGGARLSGSPASVTGLKKVVCSASCAVAQAERWSRGGLVRGVTAGAADVTAAGGALGSAWVAGRQRLTWGGL